VRHAVQQLRGRDLLEPGPHRYLRSGPAVATHLLRVACGLDSMVLGDVQILGQVKDAYALARQAGTAGVLLERLLETALHAGKRARAETAIGAGHVSMSSSAVAAAANTVACSWSVRGKLRGSRPGMPPIMRLRSLWWRTARSNARRPLHGTCVARPCRSTA
jgi:hypothetical protein